MAKKFKTTLLFGVIIILFSLLGLKICSPPSGSKSKPLVDLLVEYRAELEQPGLNIKTAALTLENADAVFAFVRDYTAYSPYFGRRQTANNMLRTRIGNSPDRAFLLAEILKEMGWKTTLYQTDNPKGKPRSGSFQRQPSKVLKQIARRIGYDLKQKDMHVAKLQAALNTEAKNMNSKVEQTIEFLHKDLSYSYAGHADNNQNIRRVFVVATKEGEKERYFDPTYPDLERIDNAYEFWHELPPKDTGIELWMRNNQDIDQLILSWEGQSAGHDMSLSFLPTHDPASILNGLPDPTKIDVWTPILQIGRKTITGRPFGTEGWAPGIGLRPPSPNIMNIKPINPQAVSAIAIQSIDSSNFPIIDVQISLEGQSGGSVLPQHLNISDNGTPVKFRVNKLIPTGGAISIVSDVSGSMIDIKAFEISKQAIIRLSEMIPPQTPVGLISFAWKAKVEVALDPLGGGEKIRAAANALTSRDYTGIYNGLNTAASAENLANGTIVLVTDGVDNVGGSLEDTLKNLNSKNIKVIAIALGPDADHKLIKQIADGTNGMALTIKDVSDLDEVYTLIGRQLSGYTTISYTAQDSCFENAVCKKYTDFEVSANNLHAETPPQIDAANIQYTARDLSISLRGTILKDKQTYEEPQSPPMTRPKLYLVFNTGTYSNWGGSAPYWMHKEHKRDLFFLDSPDIGWNLTGRLQLMFDSGSFTPDVVTAAYISSWIGVLRSQVNNASANPSDYIDRPSYDLISTINSFRTLTSAGSGTKAGLSGGPNIYMKRSMYLPRPNGQVETEIFDVIGRWARGYGAKDDDETLRLDVALAIAEGNILGGENALDAILAYPDDIIIEPWKNNPPISLPQDKSDYEQIKGHDRQYYSRVSSSKNPNWIWVVDRTPEKSFLAVYAGDGILAKGGHIERLAIEFDKIDKMYELYTNLAGSGAGLNAVAGTLLGQIAAFKQEENKLWCFSTLMLGHVSESIGDPDALLNQSPQAAKTKSAKLCKMEFEPENFGKHLAKMAVENAANEAKSWANGQVTSGVKNAATSLGAGAAINAYDAVNNANGYYNNIINPSFHMAMARASGEEQ